MGEAVRNGVNNKKRQADRIKENEIKKIKYNPSKLFEEDKLHSWIGNGWIPGLCLFECNTFGSPLCCRILHIVLRYVG